MPLSDVWRRVVQRRGGDFDFQVLKSASAMELTAYHRSSRKQVRQVPRTHLPRYYSQHEDLRVETATDGADELRLVDSADSSDMSELTIVFGYMEPSTTRKMSATALTRIPLDFAPEGAFDARDAVLDRSLNNCHLFRQQPNFVEGILLKCIESKPLYPYLHYAVFRDAEKEQRISNARNLMLELKPKTSVGVADTGAKEIFGAFEEVYSIIKTTSTFETRLPAQRHTGYIVIGFKLLDDQNHKNLEKSWLQWTGAREIYKYSPRNWNLRRITLHRCHRPPRSDGRTTPSSSASSSVPSDDFAYVLLCEFGNILHPANTVQAFDVCERLRVRNCGHVALYQVQWTYGKSSVPAGKPALLSAEGGMPRGFSHDLEPTDTSPVRRRSPLRHRDRSLGYGGIEESMRYDSYHHLTRDE